MTPAQIAQHRETFERLRALTTAPGESYWRNGECVRRAYEPVDKWSLSYDELIAAPPTPRIAYLQRRYPLAGLLRVGAR